MSWACLARLCPAFPRAGGKPGAPHLVWKGEVWATAQGLLLPLQGQQTGRSRCGTGGSWAWGAAPRPCSAWRCTSRPSCAWSSCPPRRVSPVEEALGFRVYGSALGFSIRVMHQVARPQESASPPRACAHTCRHMHSWIKHPSGCSAEPVLTLFCGHHPHLSTLMLGT